MGKNALDTHQSSQNVAVHCATLPPAEAERMADASEFGGRREIKRAFASLVAFLLLLGGHSFGADSDKLLVSNVVEDDAAMPGG